MLAKGSGRGESERKDYLPCYLPLAIPFPCYLNLFLWQGMVPAEGRQLDATLLKKTSVDGKALFGSVESHAGYILGYISTGFRNVFTPLA